MKKNFNSNLPATYFFVGLSIFLFLLEEWWGGSTNSLNLVRMGGNAYDLVVVHDQYYRLFTSMFLHAGLMHIFFNTYVLVVLGSFVEQLLGTTRFVFLFLLSGLGGSLASVFINESQLSVGASGAIWGLFGAGLALSIVPSQFMPEYARARIRKVMMINLLLNIFVSFLPMVDMWAHFGGGIVGFMLGILFVWGMPKAIAKAGALVLVLLLVYSFYAQFSTFRPWEKYELEEFFKQQKQEQKLEQKTKRHKGFEV